MLYNNEKFEELIEKKKQFVDNLQRAYKKKISKPEGSNR